MPTFDATLSGPSANSYASVAEADVYFAGRLNASEWVSTSLTNKQASLIQAAKALDRFVVWKGTKAAYAQALQWPRFNVPDAHGFNRWSTFLAWDTIPAFIKDAQCEQALFLLQSDAFHENQNSGIDSVKADTVDVKFNSKTAPTMLARATKEMIAEYGTFDTGSGGQVVSFLRA